uniref:tRNA-queuosine alpha-mannosyltransferase n=1 Tax=Nyssomyia neivai TaxID=330878 RepID=A0A1L8E226_9DIPT
MDTQAKILVIEPFYGGSHKQLLDTIFEGINPAEYHLFTLPAKKWHWRARTSAIYFSQVIPQNSEYSIMFTSSVLNLAELLGIRPDLVKCKKLIYFHENQLIYPIREIKERDSQYGWNQIMACLAADEIIFNSHFNRSSFLDNINPILNIQPDLKLKCIREKIEPKCEVIYFPINFNRIPKQRSPKEDRYLHLIWPHRWEHDKNPQLLTETLLELNKRQVNFKVSILGETFQTIPDCFEDIQAKLGDKLIHFGFLDREEYFKALLAGDIVISTAGHEFYGVSMLEATYCGCMPIAPNKLVYPEVYPKENLYNTSNQLIKMLYNWCKNPELFLRHRDKFFEFFSFDKYSSEQLIPKFYDKFKPIIST